MRRFVCLLLPLLLLAASCSSGKGSGSAAGLTIQQSDGQQLVLQQTPKRIVSLAPNATEIICAIGAGDSLVAVDKFANCPLNSKTRPEVDSFQPNLEAIAAFKPDLVYVFADQGDIVASLRRFSIPVLYLDVPATLDGVFDNIKLLGRVTGHEKQANDLVATLTRRRDAVKAQVASVVKGPRVFHELSPDYYTVRSDTFVGELYKLLKADDIADGAASAYPQLSSEAVVVKDPEVIVITDGVTAAEVKARPGWSNVSAVKNNHICVVDPDLVSRPGPRIIDGLEALAKCLYPTT